MLLPTASQQDNDSAHAALPEGFAIRTLPNFAAEFLTGKRAGRRLMRQLEVPTDVYPASGESPFGDSVPSGCPTTETGLRAEKLRRFAQDCSWATDNVYFGGEGVAQDRAILEAKSITHVVNCVRPEVQNYFDQELIYMGLSLQDSGAEDIQAVLYDVFDFIHEAKEKNGRVYVHCSQGVSRSAALVIAYTMWNKNQSFEATKEELKSRRGVVDPNVNFCVQLMSWEKRLRPTANCFLRVYRMASQSGYDPSYLVPKDYLMHSQNSCARPSVSVVLDPRGAFVIHSPNKVFLWIGSRHMQPYVDSARKFAHQLSKYEHAPVAVEIYEGSEPTDFFDLFAELPNQPKFVVQEQEALTADYERFNKSARLSSSFKESGRSNGVRPAFRRVLSES